MDGLVAKDLYKICRFYGLLLPFLSLLHIIDHDCQLYILTFKLTLGHIFGGIPYLTHFESLLLVATVGLCPTFFLSK
jgi:hypothetical protein